MVSPREQYNARRRCGLSISLFDGSYLDGVLPADILSHGHRYTLIATKMLLLERIRHIHYRTVQLTEELVDFAVSVQAVRRRACGFFLSQQPRLDQ